MRHRRHLSIVVCMLAVALVSVVTPEAIHQGDQLSRAVPATLMSASSVPCRLDRLDGVVLSQEAAAGTVYVQVAIYYVLSQSGSCAVSGRPTVILRNDGGRTLVTHTRAFASPNFLGTIPAQPIVLSGASPWASFYLGYETPAELNHPRLRCPSASSLSVSIAGSAGHVTVLVPVKISAASLAPVMCGTVFVSNLYAGMQPQHG